MFAKVHQAVQPVASKEFSARQDVKWVADGLCTCVHVHFCDMHEYVEDISTTHHCVLVVMMIDMYL